MTDGRSPEAVARELLEHWSAKDTAQLVGLLHRDAVLTGPLVPGGRMVGAGAIRDFLDAENSNATALPSADRDSYEFMARARARVVNAVERDSSAALECVVSGATGSVPTALFVDLHPEGSIARLALYLDPRPRA